MEMDLIYSLTWRFFRRNPDMNWDELFSEAAEAYCKALNRFDPSRGSKKTTVAHKYITDALLSFIQKERQRMNFLVTNQDLPVLMEREIAKQANMNFSGGGIGELLEEMSGDSRRVCQLILSSPTEYLSTFPRDARGRLCKVLRERGWSWTKIWRAFKEIKKILNIPSRSPIIKERTGER